MNKFCVLVKLEAMLVFGFHTFMWIINSVLLLHAASFENNPFHAIAQFLYSLKTSGTRGFLTFSAGTEMEQWREKGESISTAQIIMN